MVSIASRMPARGAGSAHVSAFSLAVAVAALGCSGAIEGTTPPGVIAGGGSGTPAAGSGALPVGAASGGANGIGGSSAAVGGAGTPGVGGPPVVGPGGASANPLPPVTTPPANPGNVVVRRLSAFEYDNTVRDLLGTSLTPGKSFPTDDLGAEFDSVGSALSLSPTYVKAYEQAAYALVDELFASTDAARKQKVLSCDVATGGEACGKTILTSFARKAWRRPISPEEANGLITPLTRATQLGAKQEDGLRHALAGVLLSPHFIFKLELDPEVAGATPRRLNAHELATRLSYALWSTAPDDALSAAADGGKLSTDEELSAQVDRMLSDPKSDALLDGFAGQWLDFRKLQDHEVDAALFPAFKPALVSSMQNEARRYFSEFIHNDLPVQQLLSGRFTFVDSTLATFYGVTRDATAAPDDFVRVDTSGANRAGMLTMGAFLMASSLPNRTSVVRRGQHVYERVMCGSVQAPPPGIAGFPEPMAGFTARQLAEQHRADPACIGCHQLMDPLGFGLEVYDAIGAYRTSEGGVPIDTSGELPGGASFRGGVELSDALSKDPRFAECLTHKFSIFALGRLMNQKDDTSWISYLTWKASQSPVASLPALIRTLVLSEAFRSRNPSAPM
jgi:hypothetical protein